MSTPTRRSRRAFLRATGGLGLTGLAGCAGLGSDQEGTPSDTRSGDGPNGDRIDGLSGTVTIFHAGSLSPPFSDGEDAVESAHDVQVNREAKGSVGSTKKITELGRSADVLGVADYRLLRDVLLPEYGSWYVVFVTNAMTITYTDDSTGADEVGPDNWWEVLGRDDVTFAHSDPAVDPNGYRTVMSLRLGAVPFDGEALYDEATASALEEKALVPSGTETDLIGQLQSGALDYAWNYQSAGASYDVQTIDLQPQVDLSTATDRYAEHYAEVAVEAGGDTYTGAPIAYGITVPSVAENPRAGEAWVEYVITESGREILEENGFQATSPAVIPASHEDAVPDRVAAHAESKSSLGPLEL